MKFHTFSLALLASSAAVLPQVVHAQTAAPAGADRSAPNQIEEIIVQARRTAENQQTVPIAVTTVGEEALQDATVNYVGDIERLVPSLQIRKGSTGQTAFTVRGAFSGFVSDAAVDTYVDEVPIDSRTLEYGLFDIASVQVLKGPQGTLFGRNSTGGAVLFFTRRPELNSVNGYASVRLGNYDERRLEAALNLPLGDTFAVRAAVGAERRDGPVRSVTGGPDYGNRDNHNLRLSALWRPNEVFENYVQVTDYRVRENRLPREATSIDCPAPLPACFAGAAFLASNAQEFALPDKETVNNFPNQNDINRRSITDTLTLDLGGATFKNVAYYGYTDILFTNDYDGTPQQVIDAGENHKANFYYNEAQLFGSVLDDQLDWRVGLLASRVVGSFHGYNTIFPFLFPQGAPANYYGQSQFDSRAVFGEGTYRFGGALKGLSLTLGARYTWDERTNDIQGFGGPNQVCQYQGFAGGVPTGVPFPDTDLITCTRSLKLKSSDPNYNFTLSYQLSDDWLVYGSIRRGYKAGGFNTLTPPGEAGAELATYDPETVWAYEAGSKTDFRIGDMPVRLNAAVFRSEYDSIQATQTYVGQTVAVIVSNRSPNGAPNKAVIKGGEIEARILPASWLEINAFYSRVWSEYESFTDQTGADLSGQDVEGITPETYGGAVNITLPQTQAYEEARFTLSYHRATPATSNATTRFPPAGRKSVDARLQFDGIFGSKADFAIWGANLTDERNSNGNDLVTGQITEQREDPRTYGVELRYSW
jgi:iron complex outermembrane recepter protein